MSETTSIVIVLAAAAAAAAIYPNEECAAEVCARKVVVWAMRFCYYFFPVESRVYLFAKNYEYKKL